MPILELSFASGEDTLSVRRFSVHEGISNLFEISIWAVSKNENIDLESIVGKSAGLRMVRASGRACAVIWNRYSRNRRGCRRTIYASCRRCGC
jgi:uncharacterized protein involved in type VI secretion and phage assembly